MLFILLYLLSENMSTALHIAGLFFVLCNCSDIYVGEGLPLPQKTNGRPYKNVQKFATLADFICSCSLSAIRAINSLFVGLPFVLLTV